GLFLLEVLTWSLLIESSMRTQLAVDGFLAKFWSHYHPALPHMSLTLLFFHGSSPGPGGAFLKGNYLPKNTHETAEPCECSPAEPVVNGNAIWRASGDRVSPNLEPSGRCAKQSQSALAALSSKCLEEKELGGIDPQEGFGKTKPNLPTVRLWPALGSLPTRKHAKTG
ncbi:MAG: hypothetical protein NTZ17_17250, partial [Phycisphaerae bacterium]|nr:hypothetical protein [Phycisphaerae bacterium]